jgi:hypothetical protein
MRTIKLAAVLAIAVLAVGCATKTKVPDNGSYTKRTLADKSVVEEYRTAFAIQADDAQSARASQRPIFEMEALEGQTIELKGVKRIAVYAPSGGNGQATALAAPVRELSGWEKSLAVFDRGLQLGMQGLGLYYNYRGVVVNALANRDVQLGQQRMTVEVANSVGSSNTAIASRIQAPPGTSTTISNTYDLTGSFLTLGDNSPLTHSSNNTQRQCSGGAAASSGPGSTSTTGAGAGSGPGGPGGSATC